MSKYMIRVSGPSSRGGGVYNAGNTLAEAREEAKYFLTKAPDADIAIVKSAPYHSRYNPHEELLFIVEEVQSPPIGGFRRDKSTRKFETQADIDRQISIYIERGNRAADLRERAPYESAEYWRHHDTAVKWWTKAEALMPGGNFWKNKAIRERRRVG